MIRKSTKIDFLLKRYLKYPLFRVYCMTGNVFNFFTTKKIIKYEKISRILVIQIGGIGDIIRIFPCLLSLHKEFPNTSITTLTQYGNEVFQFLPDSSKVIYEKIILDTKEKNKTIKSKLSLAIALRKNIYDLIFSPNYGLGMIEFSIISYIIGAPYRIGYSYKGSGALYTSKTELKDNEPIMLQNLNLIQNADIKIHFKEKEEWFKVPEKDLFFAKSFLKSHGVSNGHLLFCIAPIAVADRDHKSPMHNRSLVDFRAWPENRFIELINDILHSYKAKIIILGDNFPQGNLSEYIINSKNSGIINAVGKTTLGETAALIKLSDILISNDSGLLHIAIALKKRCVGIFGSTAPKQVIPSVDYCIPIWKELECSPCFIHQPIPEFNCPYNIECLKSITVEDVMKAIKSLVGT